DRERYIQFNKVSIIYNERALRQNRILKPDFQLAPEHRQPPVFKHKLPCAFAASQEALPASRIDQLQALSDMGEIKPLQACNCCDKRSDRCRSKLQKSHRYKKEYPE